jgi:hypothetical protein
LNLLDQSHRRSADPPALVPDIVPSKNLHRMLQPVGNPPETILGVDRPLPRRQPITHVLEHGRGEIICR